MTTSEPPSARSEPNDTGPAKLDDLDRRILTVLQRDARLSARAIARELGVAAGTVGDRVARLEASGVIKGYAAVIDPALVGRSLGFVIGLQITQGNDLETVLAELDMIPDVDSVLVVTGRWDLIVTGRTTDPAQLDQLITQTIWKSASFRRSETMLVIRERQR